MGRMERILPPVKERTPLVRGKDFQKLISQVSVACSVDTETDEEIRNVAESFFLLANGTASAAQNLVIRPP